MPARPRDRRVRVEGSGVAVEVNVTVPAEVTLIDPFVVSYVMPLTSGRPEKGPLGRAVNKVLWKLSDPTPSRPDEEKFEKSPPGRSTAMAPATLSKRVWEAVVTVSVIPPNVTATELRVCSEVEIQAGMVLELKRSLHAIGLAASDDQRGGKADDLEILGELLSIPDLLVLFFQGLAAPRLCVDLGQTFASDGFCLVGHDWLRGCCAWKCR
jgi:hypothetical protein